MAERRRQFELVLKELIEIADNLRTPQPNRLNQNLIRGCVEGLRIEYDMLAERLPDETTAPLDSPWVKVSERKPTQAETDAEPNETIVAYLIDGEWSIDSTMYKPECWGPPHMRTPDYWTFPSRIAPSIPMKASNVGFNEWATNTRTQAMFTREERLRKALWSITEATQTGGWDSRKTHAVLIMKALSEVVDLMGNRIQG